MRQRLYEIICTRRKFFDNLSAINFEVRLWTGMIF